ncbi:sugar transferase [bacterium]|nr:sugar transferase [bacterium]
MFFRRSLLLTLYKLSDIAILICSLALSAIAGNYLVVHGILSMDFCDFTSIRFKFQHLILLIVLIELWHIIFEHLNLYRSRRFGSRLQESFDILKATTFGSFIIGGFAFFFYPSSLNIVYILLFWASSTFLTIMARLFMRLFLMVIRNMGMNLRHVVVIGMNERAMEFAREITQSRVLGYKLTGFVDNKLPDTCDQKDMLACLDNFSDVLNRYVVDEVIIGLPFMSSYEQIKKIVSLCMDHGILVRYLADLFDTQFAKSTVDDFHGLPILTIYKGPEENWSFVVKRAVDIVLTTAGLLFLFPVFIIIGILIKIDSPGPVFFVQERVGYNKRRFKLYKFRTMIDGAEKRQSELEHLNEASGPVFKIKNDPRITRTGRILRRTSLDELPQLISVLKGDMSMVGPRPLPERDYNGFDKEWHKRRFSVRPGLTCLWQINGRHEVPFHKWMELDMEYIDNWSLLLDLKILIKTVPVVLKCSGAH